MRRRRLKNRMDRPSVRALSPRPVLPPDRRGSTLLVVMALMALLALLGVLFYTIAAQERSNAEYYLDSAQAIDEGLSPDVLFNWGLDQLVNGPEQRFANSALWGGRHSFKSVIFSGDVQPHTGEGVHLIAVPDTAETSPLDQEATLPAVDQNYDGIPDGSQELLDFSDSPVAWGGDIGQAADVLGRRPSADVDYTYPDINNLFLAYKGKALDANNNPIDVIIPSFHRPQYLRASGVARGTGKIPLANPPTPLNFNSWYDRAGTQARVLRPHAEHRVAGFPGVHRFILDTNPPDPLIASGEISSPFPIQPLNPTTGAPTSGRMGVWTSSAADVYELDVDNDGDGIREGVWLDLDFPVQERSDGTYYVPLHSFTIYSADSLFNLNVHGNITTATSPSDSPFGGGEAISKSNLGLSPGEVNPEWGLSAGRVPSDIIATTPAELAAIFRQHNYLFGRMPLSGGTVDAREAANMEWWFLLMGRPEFKNAGTPQNIVDLFPGRWGEVNRLFRGVSTKLTTDFPWPGRAGLDDIFAGGNGSINAILNADFRSSRGLPANLPYGHPLDFSGLGRYTVAGSNGKEVELASPIPNNPSAWLKYTDYDTTMGTVNYAAVFGGALTPTPSGAVSGLLHDSTETIVAEDRLDSGSDDVFRANEMAFLHLSDTAIEKTGTSSRLEKLAPFNFLTENNNRASDIRKLFSTESWDRKKFSVPRYDVSNSSSTEVTNLRSWEFTHIPPDPPHRRYSIYQFPPVFPGPGNDPFRSETRRVLEMFLNTSAEPYPQLRLNINRLISSPRAVTNNINMSDQPKYRPLTEHATDVTLTSVPTSAPFPPNTPAQQEYWARRDRQEMARDIYVLLYTFCGGDDNLDPVNTSNIPVGTVYTEAQLAEMAQFAVNVVDALDRDDVMTRFEYDVNLEDGWGLGDNAYDLSDDDNAQAGQRRTVVGVEHQQLTFSEVLAFTASGNQASNHDVTLYNDTEPDRQYLFIELRNASPKNVPLATSASYDANGPDSGIWRIEYDSTLSGMPRELTFYRGQRTNQSAIREVPGGGQFVIGTRTGMDQFTPPMGAAVERPSDFRVDVDSDGLFEVIAPNVPDPAPYTVASDPTQSNFWPKVDLDLRHQVDQGNTPGDPTDDHFKIVETAPLDYFTTTGGETLLLKRRENPYLPLLETAQNGWVTVDKADAVFAGQFNLTAGTNPGQVEAQLQNLTSTERAEPLNRELVGTFTQFGTAGTATNDDRHFNTIGYERNSNSPTQFKIWQTHFDRDFASVFELLSIPLYKPDDVTRFTSPSQLPPWQELQESNDLAYTDSQPPFDTEVRERPMDAGTMFLMPEHRDNIDTPSNPVPPMNKIPRKDNRWYRLFEFVEVGTRMHQHHRFYGYGPDRKPGIAGYNDDGDAQLDEDDELGWFLSDDVPPEFNLLRVPGKIDLNNIRHPEVLAGLLDDSEVFGLHIQDTGTAPLGKVRHLPANDTSDVVPPAPGVPNPNELRDWWVQFIRSRDRFDQVSKLFLPGLPHSRPFRSFAHMAHPAPSGTNPNPVSKLVEHTLLRRLPMDVDEGDVNNDDADVETNRRLFELGTAGEHASDPPGVHQYARHRLLSKIANNVTNRSNVYVVYITVGFFEAAVLPNGAVRIGGQVPDSPTHNGFFVIDTSNAETAYNQVNGRFDFRQLIKYRLTVQ